MVWRVDLNLCICFQWHRGKKPACQCRGHEETWGRSPGAENGNPLQHSTWGIPWTEGPDGLQYLESQNAVHDRAINTFTFFIFKRVNLKNFHPKEKNL